jgi:hypothetical protein
MTAMDTMGCKSKDSIHINMHNFPQVDVGPDIRICNYLTETAEAVVVFDESTQDTLVWYNQATGQELGYSNTITLSDSGLYICQITDTIGCIGYDTVEVVVSPDLTAYAPGHTICEGETATLQAINTGGGTASYYWYEGSVLLGQGSQVDVTPMATTDYKLIVSETISGITCSDTGFIRVKVNPLPVISISSIPEKCVYESALHLNDYATPKGGTWSSQSQGLILPDNFIPTAAGSGLHWVKYTYTDPVNLCVNYDSSIVTINPRPTPDAGIDESICTGSGNFDLYNRGIPLTPPGEWRGTGVQGGTSSWYFDPLASGIVDGGSYNLIYKYTDDKGCVNEDTMEMTVYETPSVSPGTYPDVCVD